MDNGLTFPYRYKLVQGDEEGFIQPAIGSAGANHQGDEQRRKRCEPRGESDLLREGSGISQASQKSPLHHKPSMPVP